MWVNDQRTKQGAAEDFGHLVGRYPQAVCRPGSAAEVVTALRDCYQSRLPVVARGRGHSPYGQAQVEAGLVLDMDRLQAIQSGTGSVTVEAGACWSAVLDATLPHGLTPPVLTDYLHLSVGGTLAVGGVGGTSQHYGAQVDNVEKLEVVTGTGEHVVCSPTHRGDLFYATLAGLGQCGIIVGATLRLVPASPWVRRYRLDYAAADGLLRDQRRLVRSGRFSYVEGHLGAAPDEPETWRYVLEAAAFAATGQPPDDNALIGDLGYQRGTERIEDLSFVEFAHRLADGVADLQSTGLWHHPHPWCSVFLPEHAVDAVVARVLADLTPTGLGPGGVILLYPLRHSVVTTPLLRLPPYCPVFLLAALKTATPEGGTAAPEAMLTANRALYEQARAVGGTLYPISAVSLSRCAWRAHFGRAWPALAAAKRRCDPATILTPGQGIFC